MYQNSFSSGSVGQATPKTSLERQELIRQSVSLAMQTAYGIQSATEEQLSQVIGGLVRHKLLSAEASYQLKDQLRDFDAIRRTIDHRIEMILRQKGILTPRLHQEIEQKLGGITKPRTAEAVRYQ